MPRQRIPNSWHCAQAWTCLQQQGGAGTLPLVVHTRDLIDLFPNKHWFSRMLTTGMLPGDQVIAGGIWLCAREHFLVWLRTRAALCHGAGGAPN
jgi:hypothetical protein